MQCKTLQFSYSTPDSTLSNSNRDMSTTSLHSPLSTVSKEQSDLIKEGLYVLYLLFLGSLSLTSLESLLSLF